MSIKERISNAWNAFMNKDPTEYYGYSIGNESSYRPDRPTLTRGNDQSLINPIINKIAMDCASIEIKHVRLDSEGRYLDTINSKLNRCLTLSGNIDQTSQALKQDIVMSLLDEGCVAVVPIDTTMNPNKTQSYDILSLRTARIISWYPKNVKIEVYNDNTGKKEEKIVSKNICAIIENPLYSVMNGPNSVLKRLVRKMNLLDVVDEQLSASKLNLIIQLPYLIKSDGRRKQAERRKQEIEQQLVNDKYGIAYTDGTEKITQLNRPLENNLMDQIEYLTSMLYSQLGITSAILDGTADEKAMNNYFTRTVEPILNAITIEMTRKFLSPTAITQGQSIEYFRDPFSLIAASDLADLSDKLTRNEIMTGNEVRQKLGLKPAADPSANELRNKNVSESTDETHIDVDGNIISSPEQDKTGEPNTPTVTEETASSNNSVDDIEKYLY